MVPVKNSAGCAAAVFHKPDTERTPEKNTDKVAYIKRNRKKKKHVSSDDPGKIKDSDNSNKQKPDSADFKGVAVAFFYVCKKIFKIADVFDLSRNKILKTEF